MQSKQSTRITYVDLKPSIQEYKRLCLFLLKRFDHVYKVKKKYLPYSQETLETLLFYIPALVTDGDLTEKESERITKLIQKQLSYPSKKVIDYTKQNNAKDVYITKEKFLAYEKVRKSGRTNMLDVEMVISLAKGKITPEDHLEIIKNYSYYKSKHLQAIIE